MNASWKYQTRCIVHVGDAPPHGCKMHDLGTECDWYHASGSEPHGLTHEPLMKRLVQLNINYAMLHITGYTDRMVFAFASCYGEGNARLLATNRYYGQAYEGSASGLPTKRSKLAGIMDPQFEEHQLGTTYSALRQLVVKSVSNSISRTAGQLSMRYSRTVTAKGVQSKGNASSSAFGSILEEDGDFENESDETFVRSKSAAPVAPQWSTPGWLDQR